MNFSTPSASSSHTYRGDYGEVNFFKSENNGLTVTIDTKRLHIRSVEASEEDINNYGQLFGDQDVMGKYATGETKTKEAIAVRIKDSWAKRWAQNDPYSGLAVFKNNSNEFIGHVVIGHGDDPGQSELAYLFKKNYWNQGFGTEAVNSVVKEFAPATIKEGYFLEGKTLEKITATARPDNPASVKILEKLGMQKIGEDKKYDAVRHHFSIDISQLSK